ncbi:hypothetical protein [Nonomuraea dietziae]|uniref:hypothetical protein n=1 Tax=Nonomuraea dietziae TaxID=65515 RepID=UPI001FE307D9|nr:hypothetical protein [Nonomuraea dietziae]
MGHHHFPASVRLGDHGGVNLQWYVRQLEAERPATFGYQLDVVGALADPVVDEPGRLRHGGRGRPDRIVEALPELVGVAVGVGERKGGAPHVRESPVGLDLGAQRIHGGGDRAHVEFGGDAEGQRLAQHRGIGVGVCVDQARQQGCAGGVDDFHPGDTRPAHRDDDAVGDVHVDLAQVLLAVEHLRTDDDELVHRTPLATLDVYWFGLHGYDVCRTGRMTAEGCSGAW